MEKLIEQKQKLILQLEQKLNELNENKTPELKEEYENLEKQIEQIDFKIVEVEKDLEENQVNKKIDHIKEDKKIMEKDLKQMIKESVYGSDASNPTHATILLPSTVDSKIVQKRDAGSFMRKYATISTASSNSIIPVEGTIATAAFGTEIAQIEENSPTFDAIEMKPNRVSSLVKVSEDALNDAGFDVEAEIVNQMGRAISRGENIKFINGTGNGEPEGIMKAVNADNTVDAAGSELTWDDIENVYYKLPQEYRAEAVWLMNGNTVKSIKKLLTADEVQNQELKEILGKKIQVAEAMDDIGTGKTPILFGDLSYYRIMDRKSFSIKPLNELYATTSQVGFLGSAREDGHMTLPEAVRVLKFA